MIRETVAQALDHDPKFRWRGGSVTRIENLSDIVFALAFGMLVSSAARPTTFSELTGHLINIIPVAAGFALLVAIWNAHFVFFRRYGVADGRIIFLNGVLLLLVLFVAYPLRFIFDSLFGYILGVALGDWTWLDAAGISYETSGIIMGYFALGYVLIYVVISLMYGHALSKADQLDLDAAERVITRRSIWYFRCQIAVGVLVGVLAVWTPVHAFAGAVMGLVWPLTALVDRVIRLPAGTPPA